ncbi:ABC transporter [Brevundimonas sp. LM2]|uniref:ABC transporter permease n=1 Tax=Brevundimonas sp. LM2 TaxID=1938605 RepID=UPI0009839601|nr:ABC transporter permease [Brevundimonas sp. LM2]AQR60890.1 ABC transporter [Brevundimonas sp. LM2]
MKTFAFASKHSRVLGALMMREVITRFGREGLGFLWLVGEPLMFCFGVLFMWSVIKPEYEHGVRLGPFVMTGYMSLLLFRHQISYAQAAVQANVGLLFHRRVQVLHLYLARNILEFMGTTVAFIVVYVALIATAQVSLPRDWGALYAGWFLLGVMSTGLANMVAALALRYEVMERLVSLLTYAMIPISGAFFMVDWLPSQFRDTFLLIPLAHGIEMVRHGVFGEFVKTYYDFWYAMAWAAIFNFLAMILLADARERVDNE